MRKVAERLVVSYGAVYRIVAKHGTPRPLWNPAKNGDERPPCGSKRAYQRHLDRGEEPDELCKEANRTYTHDFDRRTGNSRARNRAYRRLARSFPDIFDAVLIEERMSARDEQPTLPTGVWNSRTRERAYRRLASLYPDIFQQILGEEKIIAKRESQDPAP